MTKPGVSVVIADSGAAKGLTKRSVTLLAAVDAASIARGSPESHG